MSTQPQEQGAWSARSLFRELTCQVPDSPVQVTSSNTRAPEPGQVGASKKFSPRRPQEVRVMPEALCGFHWEHQRTG